MEESVGRAGWMARGGTAEESVGRGPKTGLAPVLTDNTPGIRTLRTGSDNGPSDKSGYTFIIDGKKCYLCSSLNRQIFNALIRLF